MSDVDDFDDVHDQALTDTGYWGRAGAGSVVYSMSTGRILVSMRSEAVLEPGTWGTWGGAVDPDEDLQEAALRELWEEAGIASGSVIEVHSSFRFVDQEAGFFFQNFLVVVGEELEPQINWESAGYAWVLPGELCSELHPGLQAFLGSDLARSQICDLDARRAAIWSEPDLAMPGM